MDLKITKNRLKILYWFARRPRLYLQFLREVKAFLSRKEHPSLASSPEAEKWCSEREVEIQQAFGDLFPDHDYVEITERFPDVFREAMKIINRQSFNWGGQGNVSLNYNLAEVLRAEAVLETGVAYGWSTLSILLSLNERPESQLVSVDMPFFGVTNEEDVGCVVPQKLRSPWTLLPYADRDGIPKALRKLKNPDFCHYDSDKSYPGKSWAFPKLWEALRPGGVLAVDDISDNLAFRDFAQRTDSEPIVIKTFDTQVVKHVGLLVKQG
jgi:predicted O-methyltransferase YrrM